jgi:dienelactone hydrolase
MSTIFSEKELYRIKVLLVLLFIVSFSLAFLQINKSQSYERYDRVSFESGGAILFANLYYPSTSIEFQEKKPLLIYCHGIGGQRDFDLRIPIEFTKRGFYVAALDYQGHGESRGSITNFDEERNIPALALDCSNLLNEIEKMPIYEQDINSNQIGLIGHSLGGMVVLMNQALDPRFNVTVAWAPLVDPSSIGFDLGEEFNEYTPKNLLSPGNTENLLIIAHQEDELLPFEENALLAQQITGCELTVITGQTLGGAHNLAQNNVLEESINWFELKFFGSESINGPIVITYWVNYLLIFINMILLLMIVLYIIAYSSEFFQIEEIPQMGEIGSSKNEKEYSMQQKVIKVLKTMIYVLIFLNLWEWFLQIFGLVGIFVASFIMISAYFLTKFYIHYRKEKKENPLAYMRSYMKEYLQTHFKPKIFLYSLSCTVYFLIVYLLFSYFYPFLFSWPSNPIDFLFGLTVLPVFLSMEILHKKIIFPNLDFIKDKKWRVRIMLGCILIIQASLMVFTWTLSFIPAVVVTYMIFLVVSVQNTFIYENTRNFFSIVSNSFIIIQLFFGAVISSLIGIQPVFNPLIELFQ